MSLIGPMPDLGSGGEGVDKIDNNLRDKGKKSLDNLRRL